MIEFRGYLNGAAEKHFHKMGRSLGRTFLLVAVLFFFPVIINIGVRTDNWKLIIAYSSLFAIVPLLSLIPQSRKERKAVTPKRIFTEDDYIICIADKYTESRLISEAKSLQDFGEFYVIRFPFGKISDKFVCQKSLLSKGTIQEFETLFAGKIEKS